MLQRFGENTILREVTLENTSYKVFTETAVTTTVASTKANYLAMIKVRMMVRMPYLKSKQRYYMQ